MSTKNENNNIKGYPRYTKSEDPILGKPYELYENGKSFEESIIDENPDIPGRTVTVEEYSKHTRTFNDIRDPNSNIFRYGLFYDVHSSIEDPTLLGFTCEIDDTENSPLFGTGEYSARAFIQKYSSMPEIASRETILDQFQKNIKMLFKNQQSIKTLESDLPYVKSHYLERIAGLKVLNNKFTKYKEDFLNFTLYEDVTMFTQYLAELYNNLAYSYRNGKMMIPENLLRFNLVIKVSEIRNFKTVVKSIYNQTDSESSKRTLVNINSSNIKYTLYDCNFDFIESQNHNDEIEMSGIGKSTSSTNNMDMKLYFKNVTKAFKSQMIDDLDASTNGRTDMNNREYDVRNQFNNSSFFKEEESQPDFNIKNSSDNDYKKNDGQSNLTKGTSVLSQEERDKKRNIVSKNMANNSNISDTIDKSSLKGKAKKILNKEKNNLLRSLDRYKDQRVRDFKQLQDSLKDAGLGALQDLKEGALSKFREKRGELLNLLINEIKEDIGLTQITPENVYTGTFDPNSVDNIIKDLGSTVGNSVEDFIRGFNNF